MKKQDVAASDYKDACNGNGFTLPTIEEWRERADRVIQLLDEWMKDESSYDEETLPRLKRALEDNRQSTRGYFRDGD